MTETVQCISPVDGRVFVERPLADETEIAAALARASSAGPGWRATPLRERCAILSRAAENFAMDASVIAQELTWQMGRPIAHATGEIAGFAERARHMIAIAPAALADITPSPQRGITRFIRREPLGLVFVAAPWNYPYVTAVNAVWPALLAGNTVILKPSHQTPLTAERFAAALAQAGLPEGVYQPLHLSHAGAASMMRAADFTAFTGSVAGGHAVRHALADGVKGAGLELGGKDPAYVRHDADIDHAVENLAEGAFFNAGQSCCGIERIYVHADVYEDFAAGLIRVARGYRLGDPRDRETTLGPMVRASAADFVRGQIAEAVRAGARTMVDPKTYPADRPGTPYMAPQVLIGVNHSMRVMREESFGPVVGVMRVRSDAEAIALMNDSEYGLTAAVWTRDENAALAIGEQVETGTWFMNRCDYLDPALAWTGVKNSGHGCTLSALGFEQTDPAEILSPEDADMTTGSIDPATLRGNWSYPTQVRFGPGRIRELARTCRSLGMTNPLLVTDPGLAGLPMVRDALEANAAADMPTGLFAEVQGNPVGRNVTDGVAAYRDGGYDGVVAFGGGSAIDAAKAIALMAGQARPLFDFEDAGDNWKRVDPAGVAPVVAVPTTAGTGSEVGRASVIIDEGAAAKKIIFHPTMMPGVVISDPELTLGLPPHITAATGMDALAHCLEALCAPGFHPMADGIALEGLRLVHDWLPAAYADGSDLAARAHMLVAASMGATAFQKGLGAVHSISHPAGAMYGVHHGLANAVLLPYVLKFNRPAIAERMTRLARLLGLPDPGFEAVMGWILDLRRTLGIPHSFAEAGVPEDDADALSEAAAKDPTAPGNPVPVDAAALKRIFLDCVRGTL